MRISRDSLLSAIKKASLVSTAAQVNPTYSRVRITNKDSICEVSASRGDQSILSRFKSESDVELDVCVNCDDLKKILSLTSGDISLKVDELMLEVSGDALWKLPTYQDKEALTFDLSSAVSVQFVSVPVVAFQKNLAFVSAAVPKDGMQAALFQVSVQQGAFTASDGLSLHRSITDYDFGEVPITSAALTTIGQILKGAVKEHLFIGRSEGDLYLVCDQNYFKFRAPAMAFPPSVEPSFFGKVMEANHTISFRAAELIDHIKKVAVHSDEVTRELHLKLQSGKTQFSTMNGRGNTALASAAMEDVTFTYNLVVNCDMFLRSVTGLATFGENIQLSVNTSEKKGFVLLESEDGKNSAILTQLNPTKVGHSNG